jgi:hypothetical protein
MGESAAPSRASGRGKVKQAFSILLIGRGPGGSWVHMPIPFSVEATFGAKGRVPVRGTINGVAYRSSILPRGDGTHYMAVNQTIRAAAGAGIGDTVKVVMEPDTARRTVTIPPNLKRALAAAAQDKTFAALSYSHRKELVDWIAQAKRPETRARRIEKCLNMLAERKAGEELSAEF